MGRPRLIIVVRHAQSEGNQNKAVHQTIPDHRVKLTQFGHEQARAAGYRLKDLLLPEDKLQIYTSPYRRTRETTAGIMESLGEDWKGKTTIYEEPRIREQDVRFGNFQGCSAYQDKIWQERAAYGHFFYRIPNGESAADAYDRVSGFNESLWRQFAEPDCPSVIVIVTHGLMTRVFLMKWYHFTVEEFEDWQNVDHCQFVIMRRNYKGKYDLEAKLRTWTEYEREQEEAAKTNPELAAARAAKQKKFQVSAKKWGGCPDGCSHGAAPQPALTVTRPSHHQNNHNNHQNNHNSRQNNNHEKNSSVVIDQHDKEVIEKAMAANLCSNCGHEVKSKSKKQLRPIVRIDPPSGDTSSDDELVDVCRDTKLHSGMIRGRDGGGSKSGFNSDYEAEDEVDSVKLAQIAHAHGTLAAGHHRRTDRLGDLVSDSEWSAASEGNGQAH
ncbi:hypothetical protein DRE_03865 [Drechslerella stenobrocha 248]|uniref:Phosphoglycerate mutase-like protein n=1 Tax=Drechslerella stenobrocha 248 TaxID=1043628 RepID=W7I3Q8_9PEZI|nr:hypothetical protein DRE_03865 [Drechslerella stenobrocha 248]